ncbi:MAG TPA: AAA family ATPase [Chloroflexota bacterium]|nr:AAA family ATPase [Chloroflexota bacterium]
MRDRQTRKNRQKQEQRLMFEAVLRFLGNVAGPAGTLLVLDDLQWADPDALDLLAMLLRAGAEVPLRVVGAYRDTDVPTQHPLSVLLADLAHTGLAARRQLASLNREEATRGGHAAGARHALLAYAEARLLRAYGELQAASGTSPRRLHEAALAIFTRLGARKDIEQTEQLLAAHLHPPA